MNSAEKNQIIDYLKKKHLSYPLFREVLDHFSLEIENLMESGISFQEAFLKTKIKWQEEFKMVSPDPLSFKKIPKIEADLMGTRFKRSSTFAWLAALVSTLFAFIYEPVVLYLAAVASVILVIAVLYMIVTRKLSIFEYLKITFHPLILKLTSISILLIFVAPYLADRFLALNPETIRAITVIFAAVMQIQLLALHRKKINVLLS